MKVTFTDPKPASAAQAKTETCEMCRRPFATWMDEWGDMNDLLCMGCQCDSDSFDSWASHEFGDK